MAIGGEIATFFDGVWKKGDRPIIHAADHAAWLGSQVFDGARRFQGMMPDLNLHCERLLQSAEAMEMTPPVTADELADIAIRGTEFFNDDAPLYIRPMMWTRDGGAGIIDPNPASTCFAVCIEVLPMPEPGDHSLTVAPYRRPMQDMAITGAKTGSLYPNNGRILSYARKRGFNNALSLDIGGYVAETATTNVFAVFDREVHTPVPNGCFLNGITRQRVISLLIDDGVPVIEKKMTIEDFEMADEIFLTGNIAKVLPVTRFQERELSMGEVCLRARELYWDYAKSTRPNG